MLPFLVLIGTVDAKPPEPTVLVPSAPVATNQPLVVRLVPDPRWPVSVDGCAPVELERREGDRWSPVPTQPCPASPPATLLATEGTFEVALPGDGEYRAVVAWGSGCTAGQPFAIASCGTVGTVRSAPIRVTAPVTP